MADAVRTIVTHIAAPYYAVNLTNVSDGTGETNVVKIDKSTLIDTSGNEPKALDILYCWGNVFGCSHTRLAWDHGTDVVALVLNGSFYFDYSHVRGLKDPSTDGTGDILLTTSAMVANGGYSIDLMCILRENR